MNESLDPTILVTIKAFIYSIYIYLGFRCFRGDGSGFIVYSLTLGVLRMVLGLLLGFATFFLATYVAANSGFVPPSDFFYKLILTFGSLLPSRILLWLILGRLVGKRLDKRVLLWVAGGVAISFPFDIYLCLHSKFIGPFIFIG